MSVVTKEPQNENTAFSRILQSAVTRLTSPVQRQVASIAPAGINIHFPAKPVDHYLKLITQELNLKEQTFSLKRPVASLWLRGYPLRQLQSDEITELVFRICSHLDLKHASHGERGIHLSPEHCNRGHLALLKGLGFNVIRLIVDATLGFEDRSIEQITKALDIIGDFKELRSQCEVLLCKDSCRSYLEKTLTHVANQGVEELELTLCTETGHCESDNTPPHEILNWVQELLKDSGFSLFGNKCFKHSRHPDHILRQTRRLQYSPWGFHDARITSWLGLGIGATGITEGYLCQNVHNPENYIKRVERGEVPVSGWSSTPITEQSSYQHLQSIYCYHQLPETAIEGCQVSVADFIAAGWIDEPSSPLTLALSHQGAIHLREICDALNKKGS